jgi:hypothetical protein
MEVSGKLHDPVALFRGKSPQYPARRLAGPQCWYSHEEVWGIGGIASRIHNHGTRWTCDQLHAPAALSQGERTPGTHWIGGWVGPRADSDAMENRKIPTPTGNRTPEHRFFYLLFWMGVKLCLSPYGENTD